jgi:hypothetical protein
MKVESDRRVESLRRAVDDAVHQLRAATFTLVSSAIYLFLTGLGTGDRDLLVGRVVNLPLFNANVGLLWVNSTSPGNVGSTSALSLKAAPHTRPGERKRCATSGQFRSISAP